MQRNAPTRRWERSVSRAPIIARTSRTRRSNRVPDCHPDATHAYASLDERPNHVRVQLTLLLKYAFGERLRSVIGFHFDGALCDDGTMVIMVVHHVYGAPGFLGPMLQHRFVDVRTVHALTAERWQEGRVDVQHLAAIVGWDCQELQIPGEADELGARGTANLKSPLAEGLDRRENAAFDDVHRQSGLRGPLHACDVALGRNDKHDAHRQCAGRDPVDQIL